MTACRLEGCCKTNGSPRGFLWWNNKNKQHRSKTGRGQLQHLPERKSRKSTQNERKETGRQSSTSSRKDRRPKGCQACAYVRRSSTLEIPLHHHTYGLSRNNLERRRLHLEHERLLRDAPRARARHRRELYMSQILIFKPLPSRRRDFFLFFFAITLISSVEGRLATGNGLV